MRSTTAEGPCTPSGCARDAGSANAAPSLAHVAISRTGGTVVNGRAEVTAAEIVELDERAGLFESKRRHKSRRPHAKARRGFVERLSAQRVFSLWQRHSGSMKRQPSGGTVSVRVRAMPKAGMGRASTPPRLPMPLPP